MTKSGKHTDDFVKSLIWDVELARAPLWSLLRWMVKIGDITQKQMDKGLNYYDNGKWELPPRDEDECTD